MRSKKYAHIINANTAESFADHMDMMKINKILKS